MNHFQLMTAVSDFFKRNERSHIISIPGVLADSSGIRIAKDTTSQVHP